MMNVHRAHAAPGHALSGAGQSARTLALASLAVLAAGAVLFATAWAVGGQDATSDNWVGILTVLALFTGLFGSFAALVTAVVAGVRHEPWSRLWLPLATFPGVVLTVALLELFVFE